VRGTTDAQWAQALTTEQRAQEEDVAAAGRTATRRHAAPCERCYATVILLLGQRLDWRAARSLFDEMHTVGVSPGEYAHG
jgi:pentatricopeptide repeat protein